MGEGERDEEEKKPGLQGTWFDETTDNLGFDETTDNLVRVSDNLARFDGDGNPITRDDWIEGIFQVGNVPDLNDLGYGWAREQFIGSKQKAFRIGELPTGKLTVSQEILKASKEFSKAIEESRGLIAAEISLLTDNFNNILAKVIEKLSGEDDS